MTRLGLGHGRPSLNPAPGLRRFGTKAIRKYSVEGTTTPADESAMNVKMLQPTRLFNLAPVILAAGYRVRLNAISV